jgi:RND family efflux transporter MFP subunit
MTSRTTLAIAVVLAAGALSSCSERKVEAAKTLPPVQVLTAQAGSRIPRVHYSADIVPREQVTASFKVGGYIRGLLQVQGQDGRRRSLQSGDVVRRGTVLAQINETDYTQRKDQSAGSLREAEAALQKAEADYVRAKTLFDAESLTKPDFDAATTNLEVSRARVDEARATVAQAETALKDTSLVAPLDGVVLRRSVEVGTLVSAGTPALVLADISSVKAVFGVPDAMMRRAKLGLPIPVRTESLGIMDFLGRITAIAPAADSSSRVFDVELTIPNAAGLLKPGMIATAEVPEQDEAALDPTTPVVPLRAIVKMPGSSTGFSLFVVETEGGRQIARARAVKVGEVSGNEIALTQGLKIGERVIVSGAAQLVDDEEVRVIP